MKKKEHTLESVRASLARKGAIIDSTTCNLKQAKNIGIKSWGKVDYLRTVHKYHITGVTHTTE